MASRALLCIVALIAILSVACADPAHNIVVNGDLSDWENVQSYYDPEDLPDGSVVQDGIPDVHDTDSKGRCDKPPHVYNPIVDILEVKFTHSASHLFAMIRAKGNISQTMQESGNGTSAGRSYLQVGVDVDSNPETGYCLNLGGYYPEGCGFDFHFEIEMYNGTFNTAHVILHSMNNNASYMAARAQQEKGITELGGNATFIVAYKPYTEWVYYDKKHPMSDDEKSRCPDGPFYYGDSEAICFVEDKTNGPYRGAMEYAFTADGHTMELSAPFTAFMITPQGQPQVKLGNKINVVFMLETSGEYSIPKGSWATDSTFPIQGYVLDPPGSFQTQVHTVVGVGIGISLASCVIGALIAYIFLSCKNKANYSQIP